MFALPNALTIMRILLVPVFVVAYVIPGEVARLVAFAVFALAGISDWLDGFAARKLKAGSDFGRMLDPIADKVLVAVALMMLVAEGDIRQFNLTAGLPSLLRLVPALIILSREILVSGLREFLAGTRVSVPVTAIAKLKTAVQMVAIGAMILAHRERFERRKTQREMSIERFQVGGHPTPLPGPGVYARHNAVDSAARLPDGTYSRLSVPAVLEIRTFDEPELPAITGSNGSKNGKS